MGRFMRRAACGGAVALLVSGAAWPDVPRLDLSIGQWDQETTGFLTSNDPLLTVAPGAQLTSERESYARFGVRLGSAWWAPVVRARYTSLGAETSSFEDNSFPPLIIDTTTTATKVDFEHLEGLLYFTIGSRIRAELGGGVKKFDGSIESVSVNQSNLGGTTTTTSRRELPADMRVFYGAAYAEPASWLSFGGEAVTGSESGTDVLDLTFRFIIKPLTWMGVEGGYRRLTLKAENVENTAYDFEFGGPYAGLSFLYGSKDAGLMQPDTDQDGVNDKEDQCPDTPAGATVNESGCEPDTDGDGIADARDECADTPKDSGTDEKGCPVPVAAEPPLEAVTDADKDGLADEQDQCPGTPEGTPVDANGCALGDQDQDGIADERDSCPGGAAGAVDPRGCPTAGAEPEPVAPVLAAGPDEDGDGVPDASDRCRRTPRGFKVDATGCLVKQASVLQGITFQVNSSYLMRDSEVLLLDVVEALKAQRNTKIVIQGHTCDLGEAKYNKWLSQRRANRVLEFLVRHGIDASRLLAVGYGEEQPMVPNDDERMRELNRRTVFQVVEQ
jgi:outer membrane protein OmpA-like peptidoglycan-associated protein